MLDNLPAVSLLTIMEIIGPLVLGLGLLYAILRNRKRTRSERARTERATAHLYDQAARKEPE
jgi:hypothetical protein